MIITFAHYKGGTGKTTSCLSTAGWLARAGKKVLAIDLDPQGNLTSGLGIDKDSIKNSTHHLMNKRKALKKIILETEFENIHLAPATQDLGMTNVKSYKSATQARILEKSIDTIKDEYDFILIDTPPVFSHFIINGMAAADKVILVLDPGVFALEGIETLKNSFGKFFDSLGIEMKIDSALITRANSSPWPWKKSYSREVQQNVQALLAKQAHMIPYSEDIFESHAMGIPISHYKPRSKVARAYKTLASRLLRENRVIEASEYS